MGCNPAGLVSFRFTTGAGDCVGNVIGVGPVDDGAGATDVLTGGGAEIVADGVDAGEPPPDPDELQAPNASAAQTASGIHRAGRRTAAWTRDREIVCMVSSLAPRLTAPGSGLSSPR